MKSSQTAIAVPSDWCTVAWAAEHLGVSIRQVGRYVQDGKLTPQRPRVGSRESARHKVMLSAEQVINFGKAREVVSGV